jgi:hypothetical protein
MSDAKGATEVTTSPHLVDRTNEALRDLGDDREHGAAVRVGDDSTT